MEEQALEKLMETVMTNLKGMVDVNTIVGEPVETIEGSVIIPISRVSFGYAAGGGDIDKGEDPPFAGGSGAGVFLNPMAFLVVSKEQVRLLPVTDNAVLERIINIAPEIMSQLKDILNKRETAN